MEKDPATSPTGQASPSDNKAKPPRPPQAPGSSPFIGMRPSPPPPPAKGTSPKQPPPIPVEPPYALPSVRQLEPPDIFPQPKQIGPQGSLMSPFNISFFVFPPEEQNGETEDAKQDHLLPFQPATELEKKTLSHPMDVFFLVLPFEEEVILGTPLPSPSSPALPIQPPPLPTAPKAPPPPPARRREMEDAQTLDVPVIRGTIPDDPPVVRGKLVEDPPVIRGKLVEEPPVIQGTLPDDVGDEDTLELHREALMPAASTADPLDDLDLLLETQDIGNLSTQEVPAIKPSKTPKAAPPSKPSHSLSASDLELQLDDLGGALGLNSTPSEGKLKAIEEDIGTAPTQKINTIKPPASMRQAFAEQPPVYMGNVVEGTPLSPPPVVVTRAVDLLDDFEEFSVPPIENTPTMRMKPPSEENVEPPSYGSVYPPKTASTPSLDSLSPAPYPQAGLETRKIPVLGHPNNLIEPHPLTPPPYDAVTASAPAVSVPISPSSPQQSFNPPTSSSPSIPAVSFTPSRELCPDGELHIWLSPKLSLDTMSFLYQFAGQCQLMVQKSIPARPPRQAQLGCLYAEDQTCLQWSGDPLLLQIMLPSVLESFGQLQPTQLKKIAEQLQLKEPLSRQSEALQVARQILIGTRPFAHALRDGISQLGQAQISLIHSGLHNAQDVLFQSQSTTPAPDPLREQRLMLSYQIQVNIPIQVLERRLEESLSLSLYQIVPKRLPLELIYLGVVHHFDLRNQLQELSNMIREISPSFDLSPFSKYSAMRAQQKRHK